MQSEKMEKAAACIRTANGSPAVTLREYQTLAVDSTWAYMRTNAGNPAIVMPTASGKSHVIAETARQAVQEWGARVGIVAGVKELIEQNAAKFRAIWPACGLGIYSASLNRRDRFDQVLFLQVQSAAKRMDQFGPFDLLLFDEFHLVPTKGEGLYRTMIAGAKALNPNLRVVGYSATPYRLGVGPVCGPDQIFNDIAYEARILDLIRDGYLCSVTTRASAVRADLSGVKVRGGEYVEHELAAAVDKSELVSAACDEMLVRAADRHSWIVFAVSVAHAAHVASELNARGVGAAVIHGGTPSTERDKLITDFKAQRLRALVNVNVLTTGFDAPNIDCVVMLRPTKSPGLYVQMVGRGFRLDPSKENTLVLDFSANTLEFGPIDEIRVQRARPGKAAQVHTGTVKECPACSAIVAMQTRICECGHSWSSLDPNHLDRPVNAAVLSTDRERVITTHAVRSVKYERHEKPGKPPSLRVTYQCGLRRFSEWVCLEHGGFAHSRAIQWWMDRAGTRDVPRTVEEAMPLAYGLQMPQEIDVDETDKYARVIACRFGAVAAEVAGDAPDWLRGIAA